MTFASCGETTYLPKFFRSSDGCVALKRSFFPSGMTTSLTSGLPRRLTWTSPRVLALRAGLAQVARARAEARRRRHGDALAVRRRPHADHGVRRLGAGHGLVVTRDVGLRDLQDDRVDVVAREVVLAAAGVAGAVADVDRVERRAEVDEERVVGLADEDAAAAVQVPHRRARDGPVVRERLRADVVRRDGQVGAEHRAAGLPAVAVRLAHDRVGLLHVELRVADRRDARQRVQERVLVEDLRLELEPVADVEPAVAGVVDVEVVPRAVVEAVEVRPACGILERDPVRDDRERVRARRAP